jgi:hypothetical protein
VRSTPVRVPPGSLPRKVWKVRLLFLWRDLWVGLFIGDKKQLLPCWAAHPESPPCVFEEHLCPVAHFYVCLIPCFPINVYQEWVYDTVGANATSRA